MRNLKLLSAVLLAAATFATPVLAATLAARRHRHRRPRDVDDVHRDEGDICIRAPRVGAFATEPWTDAAPCEPNTGY